MASDTSLFKLAMVSLIVSPSPFARSSSFRQTLDIATASVTVEMDTVTFQVWVDALSNTIHASVQSSQPVSLSVLLQSMRPPSRFQHGSDFLCATSESEPDVLVGSPVPAGLPSDSLTLYHRNYANESAFFNYTLSQQHLGGLIDSLQASDHWRDLTFGASVFSPDGLLKRISPSTLASSVPGVSFSVSVATLTNQTSSADEWLAQLAEVVESVVASDLSAAKSLHDAYWDGFWNRSHVNISSTSSAEAANANAVTQKYALTRYVQAIQSRTMWPIKFNGMLFTSNLPPETSSGGPDYRQWGASNWWQNTRLPYWCMLPAGDIDTFLTIAEYYLQMIPFATSRTQAYFNHTGIFFTETKTLFGAYNPNDYGCSRPDGYPVWLETNEYIHFDYAGDAGGPEISLMVLDLYMYTQNANLLQRYFPIVSETLDFFSQHYLNRTQDGKIQFWPTQVLETYWCDYPPTPTNCPTNDAPTVAAMIALTQRTLSLPSTFLTPDQQQRWTKFAAYNSTLTPAATYPPQTHNSETPELYAVHPFRVFTAAKALVLKEDISRATKAFSLNPLAHSSNSGWNQGIMDAALLGLTSSAKSMVVQRALTAPAPGYRFPAFAPHEQDYEPSADHYANMNSAVNWMLLQSADDGYTNSSIVVFSAWPCEWDVDFKLWGPQNTVVEVVYKSGALVNFNVTPASRRGSVTFANCVTNW